MVMLTSRWRVKVSGFRAHLLNSVDYVKWVENSVLGFGNRLAGCYLRAYGTCFVGARVGRQVKDRTLNIPRSACSLSSGQNRAVKPNLTSSTKLYTDDYARN